LTLKAQALASKQYISIIRLFQHCDISVEGDINVTRIKKQLNAEFDFAKDGFIEINGYSYNKNDVFEEIEKPDFTERLLHHKKIWERKAVLAILEDNALNLFDLRDQIKTFANDASFEQFFSPYFVIPFNYISRKCINENQLSNLGDWLLFDDFLQPDEREEGLRTIRIFIEEKLRVLRNVNKDTFVSKRPEIIEWLTSGGGNFLSNLPHEFYNEKSDIALYLINLTVAIQKTERRDCKRISTVLTCIRDLPEALETIITKNHKAYTQGGSSSSNTNYGWVIWVVIIVLKVMAGGC
jgi:hypothetical protein